MSQQVTIQVSEQALCQAAQVVYETMRGSKKLMLRALMGREK